MRIVLELISNGSGGVGVGGLANPSKKTSGNCMVEIDSTELGKYACEKFATLSESVAGSSEMRDALRNPDVPWNKSYRD